MAEVTICYGMTETSPVSFQSATTDPLERRVTTVGRVHPHLQVKIVDAGDAIVPRLDDRHWKGSEIPDAGGDGHRTGPRLRGYGLIGARGGE